METDIEIGDVTVHTRPATADDLPALLKIERESFEFPWSESKFITFLRRRNHAIFVAECGSQVVGFVACELSLESLHLPNIVVAEEFRRRGVGTSLFDALTSLLRDDGVASIYASAQETNDAGMSFLLKLGFQPIKLLQDFFNMRPDGFRFRWKLSGGSDKANNAALNPGSKVF